MSLPYYRWAFLLHQKTKNHIGKPLKINTQQLVSLRNRGHLYLINRRNVTRKEIDNLIKISEEQVQYALRNLRQILEHGEAQGQEVRWTKLLIGHKDLIDVLKKLKADDE